MQAGDGEDKKSYFRMTGAELAAEAAQDPDGFFARVHAESLAAATAEIAERDLRHARAQRARLLRMCGLTAIARLWQQTWSR